MQLKREGSRRIEKQETFDYEKSVEANNEAEERSKIQEITQKSEVLRRQEEVLAGKLEEWVQLYPEAFEADAETQQAYADRIQRREQLINDHELMDVLQEYGVDVGNIELDEAGAYRIKVENHFTDKRLPLGYAYKGGAARALALRSLKINSSETPRDLDVIRIVDTEPSEGLDERVSKEFMPEDASHGHGVEVASDISEYFTTRDFTFNEVVANDEQVRMTRQCLLDTVRRVIRLTDFETQDGDPNQKLLAKRIRLYAEAIAKYGDATIEGEEDWEYEEGFIAPFWLALQMERAFERGDDVAQRYTEELKKRDQIPEDITLAEEAAAYLGDFLDNFYYRYAPAEQFIKEKEWMEKYEQEDATGGFSGFGRRTAN